MKKLKIYLDTSVTSHLFADDTPDKMADTRKLWEQFLENKYDIFISDVVTREITDCSEPKRNEMLKELRRIPFEILVEKNEVDELAFEYIKGGVLKEKTYKRLSSYRICCCI